MTYNLRGIKSPSYDGFQPSPEDHGGFLAVAARPLLKDARCSDDDNASAQDFPEF
jgi:hypothetical protein